MSDFLTEPVIPPVKTLDENAQELTVALRAAFNAWVHRDATDVDDEIWISTELLLKGIFGFVAPTLVQVLDLREQGAQTITQLFAQHLDNAVQVRRVQHHSASIHRKRLRKGTKR